MLFFKTTTKKTPSKSFKQHHQSKSSLPTYDLSLLGSLKYDHIQILDIYDQVLSAAIKKDYVNLKPLLKEFSIALTNHIQVEDEQLYGYLKTLANHKSYTAKKVVDKFSSEMKNISIEIFSFLSQSPCTPANEETRDEFIKCFKKIGEELQSRINHEEEVLYSIYKNSRKVVNIT